MHKYGYQYFILRLPHLCTMSWPRHISNTIEQRFLFFYYQMSER